MTEPNRPEEHKKPEFFDSSSVYLGKSKFSSLSWVLLLETILVCVAIILFYTTLQDETELPVKRAVGWDTLQIDGNRNGHAVRFPHKICSKAVVKKRLDSTISKFIQKDSLADLMPLYEKFHSTREDCRFCHHMSVPGGGPSSCAECHRSMLDSVSIFDHDAHKLAAGNNPSCAECHIKDKSKENVKACKECHKDYSSDMKLTAVSYKSAMHKACGECHKEVDLTGKKKEFTDCKICHSDIDELMK